MTYLIYENLTDRVIFCILQKLIFHFRIIAKQSLILFPRALTGPQEKNYKMLTTLNGMFSKPKAHRIDFIKENKKKLKEISSMVNQNRSKSRFELGKSKSSQTEITRINSSTGLKENRNLTPSGCRLSSKGSMAVFLKEKSDRGSISNVSLTPKQKMSQKTMQRNQACQTIDPRRCDQLFHEGVIKYPSNKILQELADIERQKANRLDAHIKKEFYKRNKIKLKQPNKLTFPKVNINVTGKGDEAEEIYNSDNEEGEELNEDEEEEEEDDEKSIEPEPQEIQLPVQKVSRQIAQPLRAAEIIKRTTEDHITYSPRAQKNSDHIPNSKGDAKVVKKSSKKINREDDTMKTVLDPQCPPGHIPLPDNERKKTLHMLRVSHAELVREMNLLPVRTDTLRVRQRKIQLENQLNKIEEGIKVFNKSRVYVKIEE